MSKTTIGGVVVLLLAMIFFIVDATGNRRPGRKSGPGEKAPSNLSSARNGEEDLPRSSRRRSVGNITTAEQRIQTLTRELNETKASLETLSAPLSQDMFSSTVNAEIRDGETLVTGGYRTDDGNYELTFLTPKSIMMEGGEEGIEVGARVISANAGFVASQGLESLATNARNTLQHAEAWQASDVDETIDSVSRGGADMLSAPRVITTSGKTFEIGLGEQGQGYSLSGTVSRTASGGFSVRSRVQRMPGPAKN